MWPSVRAALVPFLVHDEGEGYTDWLYLDSKGLVTIGVGNLLSRVRDALALTWTRPDGSFAETVDVMRAWEAVTSRRDLAGHGGGAFASLTTIRATAASIQHLVDQDVMTFEAALRRDFTTYDRAPADAQLALMRMTWAMGPAFASDGRWPAFRAAFNAEDWLAAARECRMREDGQPATFRRGNDLTQRMFRNAAFAAANGLDPSVLQYPADLDPVTPGC